MTLRKITDADLQGVGVIGMADSPNLSALRMQEKVEEVVRKVVIPVINENVDNTVSKEELAETVFNSGAGDMLVSNYDSDMDGCVDSADNGIFEYTHVSDVLTGSGVNGKFKATSDGTYTAFTVNGTACTVNCAGDTEIELAAGAWYTFILDGTTINFKRGGVGSDLNFTVVGGTAQPASPKENTIWVNTDLEITNWGFDAEAPEYLSTGGVWIKTGSSSTGEFNAVKENAVNVYPNACYQWDGTKFATKTALIYQNGSWINFGKIYLYNNGDLCSDITGGWNFMTSYTCSKQSTYLQIGRDSQAYTVNAIDLTDVKSIHYIFNSIPSPDNTPILAVATTGTTTSFTASVGNTTYNANTYNVTYTLDVSSLTGNYYVILRNQGWADVQALQVWLEY